MCLPPSQKQAITRRLLHSSDMTEKHYRALDKGKSILAYKIVGSILLGAPVLEEPAVEATSSRCLYTKKETALILQVFQHHISGKSANNGRV